MATQFMPQDIHIADLRHPKLTHEQAMAIRNAPPVSLTIEAVLSKAKQATGLDDFGADDFKERLQIWLESYEADEGLNDFGRAFLFGQCVEFASTRLRLEDLSRRHPEIDDVSIDRPIIISGLPRSGTTNLVNLMAADRRLRSLPLWETITPIPPAGEEDAPVERWVDKCMATWGEFQKLVPLLTAMHDMSPYHIHQDMHFMAADFTTSYPEQSAIAPRWTEYILNHDQTPHILYSKRLIKAITWLRGGDRWLLKTPWHMENLVALNNGYPDGIFPITHRDPLAVIQSFMTLHAYVDRLQRHKMRIEHHAEYWVNRIEATLRKCVEQRDALPSQRSKDILFHEYMADPMAVVANIYDMAGLELASQAKADIQGYIDANPRGKEGRVIYDPIGDFGLDVGAVRERFQFYYDRFPVKIERVRGEKE